MKTCDFQLAHLSNAMELGELTSVELTEECLRRIEMSGCAEQFVSIDAEGAMIAARASDERRAEGRCLGMLDGIPFAAEDRFCAKGMETRGNCEMLRGYKPPYDAHVLQKFREAGAVLLGKLKTDGFLSVRDEKSKICDGLVGNTGAIPFALMAETGGSLVKRTSSGAACISRSASRWGMISCAPSFDCVGVMSGTASDCACLMNFLNHREERSDVSVERSIKRIAFFGVSELFVPDAECRVANLPDLKILAKTYGILSAVESASEMAMYDGIRFGTDVGEPSAIRGRLFSLDEQKLILLGTALLMDENRSGCYQAARGWREKLQRELQELFEENDLLVCPLRDDTVFLPSLAGLSAVSREGFLWMMPPEREGELLTLASQVRLERSVEK